MTLQVPDGYTVQEHPKNIRLLLPEEAGLYQWVFDVQGRTLSMQTRLVWQHAQFPPGQYEALRAFFGRIVSTEAEQVVLARVKH